MWFQNRRARYFKSKKPTEDTPKSSPESYQYQHFTYTPQSPPFAQVPSFPSPQSLPSSPGYPAPRLPQRSRLSDIIEATPTSPDQTAVPGSPYGLGDGYLETADFSDFCGEVFLHSSLVKWEIPGEQDAFLGDVSESLPESRSDEARNSPEPSFQSAPTQHVFRGKHMSEDASDLSDLTLQDMGDFNLSELEISAAMIDYLLN